MGERWRITLLGALRAERAGRVIDRFRSRKAAALLATLALRPGRDHAREELVERLWPECEPRAGRGNLSRELTSLRRQLEPPGVPPGAVLCAGRDRIRLAAAAVETDAAAFEDAIAAARRASGAAERAAQLARAVALYDGELLPGHYDDRVLAERDRLRAAFLASAHELVLAEERAGHPDRAIGLARRAAAADPLREEARRDVMRLLAASGRPDEALRQYRDLERRLVGELGAPPSAVTRDLAREVLRRAGTSAPTPNSRSGAAPAPPSSIPSAADGHAGPAPPVPAGLVALLAIDLPAGAAAAALRELVTAHAGRVARERDGVLVAAFARASDALASVLAARREIPGAQDRRTALDAGEVAAVAADGMSSAGGTLDAALRRATDVLLAASPGEILGSERAAAFLHRGRTGDLAARFRPLGAFRLGAAAEPERLFRIEPGGEAADRVFPAPRAAPAYAGNLPLRLTRFLGRDAEIARLRGLLAGERRRLITITGPAGVGKTRVAVETAEHAAEAFGGGVRFVSLADVADPALVEPALIAALHLEPSRDLPPLDQLAEALAAGSSLIVLDNLEHLGDGGAAVVRRLLERVPTLACLVTSRVRLGLDGERVVALDPLPLPVAGATGRGAMSPERVAAAASVQLLVDRAQALRPDFQVTVANAAAVAEICRRLDGLPLALEIAATRLDALTPARLLEQLERRADDLVARARDVPARHRSLRTALDWSFRLLEPELRRLLARLSVFRGGFSVEAAERVCEDPRALERLERLRARSLVQIEPEAPASEARFRLLETVREYAAARLGARAGRALARRHAGWCLALAERARPKLDGPEQAGWLDRLEAERANFVAALDRLAASAAAAKDGAAARARAGAGHGLGLRLAATLGPFWLARGPAAEGMRRLSAFLGPSRGRGAARARGLLWAGALALALGDAAGAQALLDRALALHRDRRDRRGAAMTLGYLVYAARFRGDVDRGEALAAECLAVSRETGDGALVANALHLRSLIAAARSDLERARALEEESLALYRELGDARLSGRSLLALGVFANARGDFGPALDLFEEALGLFRRVGDRRLAAYALLNVGGARLNRGDVAGAVPFAEEAASIFRDLGEALGGARACLVLGAAACERGDLADARARLGEALARTRRAGNRSGVPDILEQLAKVSRRQGEADRAVRLLGATERLRESLGALGGEAEVAERERQHAALRAALGAEAFERALAAGRALDLDRAVAYALGEPASGAAREVSAGRR